MRSTQGYIAELARHEAPDDDALELELSTFGRWARSLVGDVNIAGGDRVSAMLRPHLQAFATSRQQEFLVDEVQYILGRFEYDPANFDPASLADYLTVAREGRGAAPRVESQNSLSPPPAPQERPSRDTAEADRRVDDIQPPRPLDRGVKVDDAIEYARRQISDDEALGCTVRRVARDGTCADLAVLITALRNDLRR